ncbi:MAG TPA: DUF6529 family protein [Pseudonocardia sp.]|jgi:hypothetical protein|uniref:DUF6529 family protein n=1 Tax=Pseudonocardia sp. TaxID=60912 RepID=UPI002BB2577A|nr:DUF6529 family protein [Pseudonocardia sp.]HTF54964.1 DUF6529 family protein [Pseudonocardia sp.]
MNPEADPPTAPIPTSGRTGLGTSTLGRPTRAPGGPPEHPVPAPRTAAPPGPEASPGAASEAPTSAIPIQPGPPPAETDPPKRTSTRPAPSASHSRNRTATRVARRSAPTPEPRARLLLAPVLVGAVVAVALGAYGRLHEPTGYALGVAGFSSMGYVKAWLATVTVVFGVVQLLSGMTITGRLLANPPAWMGGLHRWSGRIALLASVPVAVQCLYALGFQSDSTRVWVHSILGCLFYGAFTTKMLSLSRPGTPRWAVPLLGGLVFTGLIGLWLTSAVWLFSTRGVHL